MKKSSILLAIALLSSTSLAFAKTNTWQTGFAQGTQEYGITSKDNALLLLSCNIESGLGHNIMLYPKGMGNPEELDAREKPLTFYFNANQMAYPVKQHQAYSQNEWQTFISKLATAQQIDIYHKNQFVMQVKPNVASRKQLSQKMISDCNFENLRSAEE
ncbi:MULTISPECIES: hypothetical protein [unclassified Acinetobacter]|uniref:hypothetical protein n=1 Tax=unclassified Acinetobacter TaxID=196816 RepID=UPI0035BA52AE